MDNLKIQSCFPQEVTLLSNQFLDRFMPRANGEFVKIYLYLFRAAGRREEHLSLSTVADRMNCTEKDVLRALRYWENEKVLSLTTDSSGTNLTGITFLNIEEADPSAVPVTQEVPSSSLLPGEGSDGKVTMERAGQLKDSEEIRELLFISEQYLGKPLTRGEMQRLLYFYDGMHFSTDLIDYLIEYCVSSGHKSLHYIEKVACSWYEEGIHTVREARASVNNYHRDYYEILKAFGITNRSPVEAEIAYMKKWIEDYGFSMEVIREACTRTVMKSGKTSFSYTDGILSRWKKRDVKEIGDVRALDAEHEKKAETKTDPGRPGSARPNRFNDFEQRTYDFDDMEQQLLKGKKDNGSSELPV